MAHQSLRESHRPQPTLTRGAPLDRAPTVTPHQYWILKTASDLASHALARSNGNERMTVRFRDAGGNVRHTNPPSIGK